MPAATPPAVQPSPAVSAYPAPRFGRVHVLDSHTAGEPTRLVVSGGPDLGLGPIADRLQRLQAGFPHFRSSIVCEPRGSNVLVGALLCPPHHRAHTAAVIFFNDVGYLGMCGHGAIGLVHSLAHLGRIAPGEHGLETPVGAVRATLHPDGAVTIANVPAYCAAMDVSVDVPGLGTVTGDIAWGGNWFFLIATPPPVPLELSNAAELTRLSVAVRTALRAAGIAGIATPPATTIPAGLTPSSISPTAVGCSGHSGHFIDHIEWFAPAHDPANQSRNFVLCPGAAFDRSPCGTGTSAKLATLAARGLLAPGEAWRQEGILGTVFSARYQPGPSPGFILPEITGRAFLTAESTLLFDPQDPFAAGLAIP